MAEPQVTQADRETAVRFCPSIQYYHPPGCPLENCTRCEPIALELAKVRQQAHAEMQAACQRLSEKWKRGAEDEDWPDDEKMCRTCLLECSDQLGSLTLDGTNALEEMLKKHRGESFQAGYNARGIVGNLEDVKWRDEAVAAVVDNFLQRARSLMSTLIVEADSWSEAMENTLYELGKVKPNTQQILAERDRRVEADHDSLWRSWLQDFADGIFTHTEPMDEGLAKALAERDKRVREETKEELMKTGWQIGGSTLGSSQSERVQAGTKPARKRPLWHLYKELHAPDDKECNEKCRGCALGKAIFLEIDHAETRMREPMECGHPKACLFDSTPPNSRVFRGDGVEQRLVNCTACAQQREEKADG